MQNKRTKIIIIIAVILLIIVAVYGVWASLSRNKDIQNETAEEKMNREILLSLRGASNEPELSTEQKAAILFSLRSAAGASEIKK